MERTYRSYRYETDDKAFPAETYKTAKNDVAWSVLGWKMESDEDTEWTGIYNRTDTVLAIMVGDDRVWEFEKDDLEPLQDDEYCGGCGQIGCGAEIGVK